MKPRFPVKSPPRARRARSPQYEPAGYANLAHEIEQRLLELNMSKSKFAAIGGPGRLALHTLGRRGYAPNPKPWRKSALLTHPWVLSQNARVATEGA